MTEHPTIEIHFTVFDEFLKDRAGRDKIRKAALLKAGWDPREIEKAGMELINQVKITIEDENEENIFGYTPTKKNKRKKDD